MTEERDAGLALLASMALLAPFDDRLRSNADFDPYCGNGLIDQSLQLIACQIGVALLYLGRRLREYFLLYCALDHPLDYPACGSAFAGRG